MIFQTIESKSFQERQSRVCPGTWLGAERRMPGDTVTVSGRNIKIYCKHLVLSITNLLHKIGPFSHEMISEKYSTVTKLADI